jgi:hypothetical protein
MVHIVKNGALFTASHISGPTHNRLSLKLKSGLSSDPFIVTVLPPVGGCCHGNALTAEEMIPSIRAGVERANAELGRSFGVEHAEIVANDSRRPTVYEVLAHRIVTMAAAEQTD